ncbi:P63C domain-containing protein [Mucilaginibacter frigoritolerans]|uniref:P63C domain-containing protein n=1 Tax=Mucilaginibacter frigoritolerans TaxID=652788 RepID=A0A562U836_9SPHI|nr:P63C domain-containing protein [Mucilaginibacter frigoritolerans]TWJ01587.1 P63C domain-containing protein [Mucilaginibacter frigoritolerans]
MEEEEKGLENKPIKKEEIEKSVDKIIEKQSIIEGIVEQTESLTKKQASRKKKNRHEIVNLISGKQIDLVVLASEIQKHPSQFSLEYYTPVFKILNLTGDPAAWIKDKKVADFTVENIYSRYEKNVLPTIQAKNKYVGYCVREHKYYQYFTQEGIDMLQVFIRQAIETIEESTSHYDFKKRMFAKYKVPYQIESGI